MNDKIDHAMKAGSGTLETIADWAFALKECDESEDGLGEFEDERLSYDELIDRAHEMPLSIRVRSGWCNLGEKAELEEFEILTCTGGPAVRILGELNGYGEPMDATLQVQDWFQPWTDHPRSSEFTSALLEFSRLFYYGEG